MEPGDWIALAGVLLGAIGGLAAIFTYRRDVRVKQTDWLYQLFEKFYEKSTYQTIRKTLDYKLEPAYSDLQRQIAEPGMKDLEEKFSDYLNFFEFICNLQQTGRMRQRDIDNMFDYYLTSMSRIDWVRDYTARNGFEALTKELARRRAKSPAP